MITEPSSMDVWCRVNRTGWCIDRTVRLLVGLVACLTFAAHAEQTWPVLDLPQGLATYAIGEQIVVNGMPMRMTGFVSSLQPGELIESFRRSLGSPLVESNSGNKRILARATKGFYITVQVEAAYPVKGGSQTGSKGTIAVADMQTSVKNHEQQRIAKAHLLDRMPAGSTVTSDIASEEGGKSAHHIVIINGHAPQRNRDAVIAMLGAEGYVLEREVRADTSPARNASLQTAGASTMYFKDGGNEAMAVITRSGQGSAIVLNIVASLQADK